MEREHGRTAGERPPVGQGRHDCPVVLVHGIAAHDRGIHRSPLWGRVPDALREHGYAVFFGDTDAWGSVRSNGRRLVRTVEEVLAETGAPQVILVAHSKGGLDVRSALLEPGMAAKVRGVATLSSPHRGMRFCSLLNRSRFLLPHVVSHLVNGWSRLRGDRAPDSIQALRDLTVEGARALADLELDEGRRALLEAVPFRSFGFRSRQRRYPRNHVAAVVRHLDGENDGLVPLGATAHGRHGVMTAQGRIDHDDCTDRAGRDLELMDEEGSTFRSPAEFVAAVVDDLEAS